MSIINSEETQPIRVPDKNLKDEKIEALEVTRPVTVNGVQKSLEETMPINTNLSKKDSILIGADEPQKLALSDEDMGSLPPVGGIPQNEKPKGRKRAWLFILGGVFCVVLLGLLGGWLGYSSGLKMRLDKEYDQVAVAAVTQYQLGVEDQNAGRLDMARKRYEYVVQLDPNFPDIQDRLAEVMLYQAQTNIPTIVPTETPIPVTPTPDLRGIEEKFNAAVAYMRASDWENAINALEIVRKEDIQYRAVDVDGMFYIALRFRGIQKISSGSLEPGIYDLTLSALFAPLDGTAEGYRSWARYYLTGAAFWGVDWKSVVEIFGEIYPSMPNMVDSSGITVQERYRIALIKYADQLAGEGKYCEAREYYAQALAMAENSAVAATATEVQLLCEPPKPTAEATSEITVEPTAGISTETPTPEVIVTEPPTAEPTAEPTAGSSPTP